MCSSWRTRLHDWRFKIANNTSISQNERQNQNNVGKKKSFFLCYISYQIFFLLYLGSHKRSHSLGDKEIRRSPPSPAPEQPFRDRSNTLSEKPALPVIRDKYKDLTGEVEVRGLICSTNDFVTCLKGCKYRILFLFILSTAAGERTLRIRVAEVSGKRPGGFT